MSVNIKKRDDVPAPLLRALTDPKYVESLTDHFDAQHDVVKGAKSISVTTLPRSARQRILEERHGREVTVDPVSDGFWKMFGSMIHLILERYPDEGDLIEVRKGIMVNGVYLHGQADRLTGAALDILQDYKIVKAESMLYGDKREYHAQLNVLRRIFELNGHKISKLENIYIFRNFDPRMVKEGTMYPKDHFLVMNIPIWPDKVVDAYIRERIEHHVSSEQFSDDDLPFCTDDERWMGLPQFLAYKVDTDKASGEKKRQSKSKYRSTSNLDVQEWLEDPANKFAKLKVKGKNTDQPDESKPFEFEIVERKAKPTRCSFCHFFQWCNQRKAEVASQSTEDSAEEDEANDS